MRLDKKSASGSWTIWSSSLCSSLETKTSNSNEEYPFRRILHANWMFLLNLSNQFFQNLCKYYENKQTKVNTQFDFDTLTEAEHLGPATLLKERLWHRCFPVNFTKFAKNTFSCRTPSMAASKLSQNFNKNYREITKTIPN